MLRHLAKAALSAGIIAAALSVAAPAFATTTFTVSGGTSWTGVNSGPIMAGGFSCSVSTMAGTIKNGSGLSGTDIGEITSWTFGNSSKPCTGSSGSTMTGAQASGVNAHINFVSFSNGVITGSVSNIDFIVHISDLFGTCTAAVSGTANFTYSGGDLDFTGTGTLTVSSATGSGCAGVITAGDSLTLSGKYVITPPWMVS